MIDPKRNRKLYIEILRKMTPEQRIERAFELSVLRKQKLIGKLRRRYPKTDERGIRNLQLELLMRKSRRELAIREKRPFRVVSKDRVESADGSLEHRDRSVDLPPQSPV